MKKLFLYICASILLLGNLNAQNYEQKKQEVLAIIKGHIPLKDYKVNLAPGNSDRFKIVLSKGNTYAITYRVTDKFQMELLNDKNEEIIPKVADLNKTTAKATFVTLEFNITNSGVYTLNVTNVNDYKINEVIVLSLTGKGTDAPSDEIVEITSTGSNFKDKVENEEVFFIVENMPAFPADDENGSQANFREYLSENIQYPQVALDKGIEGRLFVQFIIDKEGYVRDAKVVRNLHPALDQEALRLVYSSPRWKPGTQRGRPVNVSFTFPIMFKIKKE